ncbi:MAG TPA: spore cortex-lytic enzyme [Paenibacillus sp.]|uniref:spore cortex-lytic enzyme n=1 Tax=Paenibacillus sp. TaxID=58172 RepID=UPI0028D6C357|nr:spore cortex-lytic enzyme [Paenibacillus sp.]HUC90909.1 spore cortex-lytic enzyme [Paenibacillus sp.]
MKIRLLAATSIIVCLLFGAFTMQHLGRGLSNETFGTATLRLGSSGKDVYELQGRLKYLGYYGGEVDGQFGQSTRNAVTWFQWKFGLKSNGVVEGKTKLKLWEATKEWRPTADELPGGQADKGGGGGGEPGTGEAGGIGGGAAKSNRLGLSENDLKIMANAVYGEARGEPYEGQVAVAAVILNRVQSESFPNTISGVIFQPRAFTAVADGQIWLTPNERARKAVNDAVNGWDPTGGALYYFNPDTATSGWIWTRPQIKTIGKHIFAM